MFNILDYSTYSDLNRVTNELYENDALLEKRIKKLHEIDRTRAWKNRRFKKK